MTALRNAYDARVAEGLRRDPQQEAVVARLDGLRDALQQRQRALTRLFAGEVRRPRGLYIWGDVGRGKSMLVDMLMADLGRASGRRSHFQAFMRDIHCALHAARTAGVDDPVAAATDELVGGLDLLALDEVEITDITDAMIVGRVFARLFGQGVVLVATSNSAPQELYRDGLKRDVFLPFVRLLEAHCDVVHLGGDRDYRDGGEVDGRLYLSENEGDVAPRMEAMWRAVSDEGETSMSLKDRITLRSKGPAVRATFDDLCRGPLAPSDYLTLARQAEVVFLEAIPLLGERDHDAARRFILLIDALYDMRCGIVIGAAAPPGALQVEGEFEAEFRRTQSRLREMTGPDWPGRPALT